MSDDQKDGRTGVCYATEELTTGLLFTDFNSFIFPEFKALKMRGLGVQFPPGVCEQCQHQLQHKETKKLTSQEATLVDFHHRLNEQLYASFVVEQLLQPLEIEGPILSIFSGSCFHTVLHYYAQRTHFFLQHCLNTDGDCIVVQAQPWRCPDGLFEGNVSDYFYYDMNLCAFLHRVSITILLYSS